MMAVVAASGGKIRSYTIKAFFTKQMKLFYKSCILYLVWVFFIKMCLVCHILIQQFALNKDVYFRSEVALTVYLTVLNS